MRLPPFVLQAASDFSCAITKDCHQFRRESGIERSYIDTFNSRLRKLC